MYFRIKDGDEFNNLGKVIRTLLPLVGKPSITSSSTSGGQIVAKITGYRAKSIDEFIRIYQELKAVGIEIEPTEQLDMTIAYDPEIYLTSFMKSDNPEDWLKANEKKKEQVKQRNTPEKLAIRRKLKEVQTALDGYCTFHKSKTVEGKCIHCEYLKKNKGLPNKYHTLYYSGLNLQSHNPATCLSCKEEREFNENYKGEADGSGGGDKANTELCENQGS